MKKILIIIVFFNSFYFCAQEAIPVENFGNYDYSNVNGKYFKDINHVMNKFVGMWIYENGTKRVEIKIYKVENVNTGGGYFKDEFYVKFKYTENDIVIFNTFETDEKHFISGGGFWYPGNANKYRLLYLEPGQPSTDNYQYLVIEYIPNPSGGMPQMIWNTHVEPKTYYPILPQMPLQMLFTKQ